MADDIDVPNVDAITVGSIGPAGQRTFYLQAWSGRTVHSLKLEKQQVAALGGAIDELLSDVAVDEKVTLPDLLDPGTHDWVVGTMGLTAYDSESGRVTLVLEELVLEGEEDEPARARFGLSLGQLAALAVRCAQSVEGGRPPCPLCARPMDAEGHVCPKTNGSTH